jgi:mRNA-degrading endonuclease toxin of MazEF toxin-antitoxin module
MWPPPEPGDIVWCRFPERPRDTPGPRPRPALVLEVIEHSDGVAVKVAYGTSQRLDRLFAGEVAIRRLENRAAYKLAGLSYDTKFDLRHILEIPWDEAFFAVPKQAPHGPTPKLGTLHPSLMKALESAVRAIKKK